MLSACIPHRQPFPKAVLTKSQYVTDYVLSVRYGRDSHVCSAAFGKCCICADVRCFVSVIGSNPVRSQRNKYDGTHGITRMTGQNGFSLVMIFHQLHYFFYAHITLTAMSLLFSRVSTTGIVYAALLFCGTWITYMSVEPIVSRLTNRILPMFYIGHIGIGVLLFVMHDVTSVPLFIVLWLVTGFGGGVVYTISAKAKDTGNYQKDSMTIAENIGHTPGLLTAVGVAAVFGNISPQIMLVSGSASALFAVAAMTLISGKENYHENIHSEG